MSSQSSSTSSGASVPTVVTIVFVVLKLVHVINWSWWWVLSPIWISIGLFIAIGTIALAVWLISHIVKRARQS